MSKFCIFCGKENDNDADFCIFCGKDISKSFPKDVIQNSNHINTLTPTDKKKGSKKIIMISVATVLVIAILATVGIIFVKQNKDEPTEATETTASSTQAEETATITTNGERVSFGCFDDEFSVILPDDYCYEIKYGKIYFYEKYNYNNKIEDTDYGYIGCISSMTDSEVEDYGPGITILGTANDMSYVFQKPSGFGISDDKTGNEKLSKALKKSETIINSFEFVENSDKVSSSTLSGERTYFNDGYSLILPNDWVYEETDNGVFFYDTYNYGSVEGGLLIYIVKITSDEENEYSSMYQKIKENNQFSYWYMEARDVAYNPDNKTSEEKYRQAYNEIQNVLSSFTCTN
ncbi:MAG: hypothetical protein J1E41_01330 [Ruminococcus sp.]|nr:hypothetical protein [Ruminococcus sp.]